jgi:AcrR family transcriptional regulator
MLQHFGGFFEEFFPAVDSGLPAAGHADDTQAGCPMARPSPPKQLRAKRTRQRLLAAARRVFAERGYEVATVDDIAEAAGCSKGAYYFHFATKEEVLLALAGEWAEARSERLREKVREGAPLTGVLGALIVPQRDAALQVELWSQGQRNARLREQLVAVERDARKLIAQSARRAQREGSLDPAVDPRALASAALALQRGVAVRESVMRAPERARRLEQLIGVLAPGKALPRAG